MFAECLQASLTVEDDCDDFNAAIHSDEPFDGNPDGLEGGGSQYGEDNDLDHDLGRDSDLGTVHISIWLTISTCKQWCYISSCSPYRC